MLRFLGFSGLFLSGVVARDEADDEDDDDDEDLDVEEEELLDTFL